MTELTPTLSLALATIVRLPDKGASFGGEVMLTTGGVVSVLTGIMTLISGDSELSYPYLS